MILAFGLYHVHSFSGITEGGALGLTLLLWHWFHISPAVTSMVLNLVCYAAGWKILGKTFILYSMISCAGFSASYAVFESMGPLWPGLQDTPLLAAVLGALFVGVGVGLCVRVGGAPSADDALALSLSRLFSAKIQWVYLASDLIVLGLSITYIPLTKLLCSLLTVLLSGQLIGLVERIGKPE